MPAHPPQICSFCYIANKTLYDAIDACRDLPLRFDVEFRPFSLMCSSSYSDDANNGLSRKAYYAKKFGKEQAEAKWKVSEDMVRKAGLTMHASISLPISAYPDSLYVGRKMV